MAAIDPNPRFARPEVAQYFDGVAPGARRGLLLLRGLILHCAAEMPEVGRLEEALRWKQPAYLTPETKSGSTLRLAATAEGFALYAHCQTTIISSFAEAFPGMDRIEGNRALHFRDLAEVDPDRHAVLIRHALTYHRRRSRRG
ncbi:DUF1801 domain-containing protein [Pseudooceanicola sp.]|uniref:DUF1801 domain-containing protein n=1 Tax=Pseudooceanicola sp. TaxID=1914328 RepID=UPI0026103B5E|nr:DUF1801 domain-containing protein [Pseudooceanicola sp.]MDF1856173.1 DUF1801 domain-containing protein [Pseudooceanicola sp.]